jgi:hypothetical protein
MTYYLFKSGTQWRWLVARLESRLDSRECAAIGSRLAGEIRSCSRYARPWTKGLEGALKPGVARSVLLSLKTRRLS